MEKFHKYWSSFTSAKYKKKMFLDIVFYFLAFLSQNWISTSFFKIIEKQLDLHNQVIKYERRGDILIYGWIYFIILSSQPLVSLSSFAGIVYLTFKNLKKFFKLIYKWVSFNYILKIQNI